MTTNKIGIIGAMKVEAEGIISQMDSHSTEVISGITFYEGILHGKDCVFAVSGVGKVFAAVCAEIMILHFNVTMIINSGVAGARADGLSVGDIVVADSLVQHDMDTSAVGDPIGMISGINVISIYTDTELSELLVKCASKYTNCIKGVIASGDQFVADNGRKEWIKKTYHASACEMESASIAQVCYINKIPFCIMRAISDGSDGNVSMDYPAFVKMAAERAIKVLDDFLDGL